MTLNGIGAFYYGKRDFGDDGSYITTEWFVLVFFPIVPLRSVRVIDLGISLGAGWLPGITQNYQVLKVHNTCWRQVWCIYSWIAVLIGSYGLSNAFPALALITSLIALLVLFLPAVLRNRARKRAGFGWIGFFPWLIGLSTST